MAKQNSRNADPSQSSASSKASEPRRPQAPRQRMQQRAPFDAVPGKVTMPEQVDVGDTQFVGSVARALSVLNAFREGDSPLGNAELAERTGLTKPTVSRLTYTLERCGYLSFNPRQRVYELGPSVLALGNIAVNAIDVRALARPLMQALARQANFNVGLGTRDQHLMVYTDACEGEALIGLRLFAGSRIPIMTSAMGRAYLAGLDKLERENLLAELKPRYGDEWSGLIKAATRAARDVEEHGFCVSAGDWQKDIHGVAAPIRHPLSGRVYALNLGGPAYLLPESLLRGELGHRIADTAAAVQSAISPPLAPLPQIAVRERD